MRQRRFGIGERIVAGAWTITRDLIGTRSFGEVRSDDHPLAAMVRCAHALPPPSGRSIQARIDPDIVEAARIAKDDKADKTAGKKDDGAEKRRSSQSVDPSIIGTGTTIS